jgi:hypothetical protein
MEPGSSHQRSSDDIGSTKTAREGALGGPMIASRSTLFDRR